MRIVQPTGEPEVVAEFLREELGTDLPAELEVLLGEASSLDRWGLF